MRGTLATGELTVIKPPRDTDYREEANALNQRHYERKQIEKFGKAVEGRDCPNKEHIYYNEKT